MLVQWGDSGSFIDIAMLHMFCGTSSLEVLGFNGCYQRGWLISCLGGGNGFGSTHYISRTLSLYVWYGHRVVNEIGALLKMQKTWWLSWKHCLLELCSIDLMCGVLQIAIPFRLQRISLLLCFFWFLGYFVFIIVYMKQSIPKIKYHFSSKGVIDNKYDASQEWSSNVVRGPVR